MALQEKISTVVGTWVNKLEPDFLYADFLQNPPIGFEALLSPNGLPTFAANFDLMTTMDDEDRKRYLLAQPYPSLPLCPMHLMGKIQRNISKKNPKKVIRWLS